MADNIVDFVSRQQMDAATRVIELARIVRIQKQAWEIQHKEAIEALLSAGLDAQQANRVADVATAPAKRALKQALVPFTDALVQFESRSGSCA